MIDSVTVMILVLLLIKTYQTIKEKNKPKAYRIVAVDLISQDKKLYLDKIN